VIIIRLDFFIFFDLTIINPTRYITMKIIASPISSVMNVCMTILSLSFFTILMLKEDNMTI